MPLTIKYNGNERGWDELSITGKQSVWNPGQQEERSDAEAALLIGTGLFSRVFTDSLEALGAEVEALNGGGIAAMVKLTQAEYDALTPDESTLYVIVE